MSVTVITKGQTNVVLKEGKSARISVTFPGGGGSSGNGSTTLAGLTDVDTSKQQDGSPLIYDANTAKYTLEKAINGGEMQ